MDVSAKEIVFTASGCNFCDRALESLRDVEEARDDFKDLEAIQKAGKGRDFDCLIGLSGGVDSAWALLYAHTLGLRVLAFSVDNGWNDPKADENIFNLVVKFNIPFKKVKIDWDKFRELQAAFMKAGQINIEIPTDHVLMAVSLQMAARYGIKYILSGGNVATESIMPESWGYNARDLVHIRDVYKWATGGKLTGLPVCSLWKWNWYKWLRGIKTVYILDHDNYNREAAKRALVRTCRYQDLGEKHEENIFTRWFQNFYLFEKFGIDKRKAHYSSLIMSRQMTREEALEKLQESPVYPELGLEKKVLKYPRRLYTDFKTNEKTYALISATVKLIRNL
jgi:hypothetical protein